MDAADIKGKNLLLAGDYNFQSDLYSEGISFAEEVVEALNLPYVNYLLASNDKVLLEKVNAEIKGIAEKVYDTLEENLKTEKLSGNGKNYIAENISSLILEFDEQDMEGIEQILRLPYFHGIINDMVEVKFV